MFSPICFTNFFQEFFSVRAVEKEKKLLIGQNRFVLSLPVEKEIMEKFVHNEFKIGKLSDEFVTR